jgi:hypothetical protein
MNCDKYLQLIDDLIEDALDDHIADEVSLHILDCQNCTAHFEMLEREKQIYSHYLFDIEPPVDLQRKFEAKLSAEEKATVQTSFWANISAVLRPNFALPVFAALLLCLLGLGWLNLENPQMEKAENIEQNFRPKNSIRSTEKEKITASTTPETIGKMVAKVKVEKNKPEIAQQPIVVKETKIIKRIEPKAMPKMSEEELQFKQIQVLEVETAKQVEKVELLLRAFRNARMIEGSEIYDVAYESQQARKLLPNNIALRQKAEFYGTIYSEEILSKVEPVLLDIANLDANPSPEQVLEIKDRVRNQNIIASLQGF